MSMVSHLHHFFHAETCQSFYVAAIVKPFRALVASLSSTCYIRGGMC
jgi:hypothetical protein